MRKLVPLVTGLVIVVAAGVVHGIWTDRWKLSDEPEASGSRLNNVAWNLGEKESLWEGEEGTELDSEALAIGEISHYMNRLYVKKATGQRVSVLIVCGRPGPIAQHTPDICMGGEGYEPVGGLHKHVARLDSKGASGEFIYGNFYQVHTGGAAPGPARRVFWSWNATGNWTAPQSPRWTFGRYPALYKIYLQYVMVGDELKLEDDPAMDLAKVLLPELKRALFPGS
jgi:hypothetical protein